MEGMAKLLAFALLIFFIAVSISVGGDSGEDVRGYGEFFFS